MHGTAYCFFKYMILLVCNLNSGCFFVFLLKHMSEI